MPGKYESRDYDRFDELAEEFAERFRRGERPNLQEYVDRLPEMADEIREMFLALVEVERAEGDARQDTPIPVAPERPSLRQIGDYRIVREIGRGGMGVVYEADQVSLGRHVALKVLPAHVVGDRKSLERFRREARAAGRLHHTNIVPVYDVGRDGDFCFYAMQLIQGQGLEQVIDELRRLRDGGKAPEPPSQFGITDRASLPMAELLLSGRLAKEGLDLAKAAENDETATALPVTERIDPVGSAHLAPVAQSHEPAPAEHRHDLSKSAVLPGGTHVSEIDTSGRRQPFFRSVAQIGRQAAQGASLRARAGDRSPRHQAFEPLVGYSRRRVDYRFRTGQDRRRRADGHG